MEMIGLTRGGIRVQDGESIVKIRAEMLVPTPGLTDFLIYKDSFKNWEPPFDAQPISDTERRDIMTCVQDGLMNLGRVPEII